MIVTYELAGVCPNGHAVQGVTVATVRVNLTNLVNIGKGPNLVLVANCLELCGGLPEIRTMQLDAESKRRVAERRTQIRASRVAVKAP